MPPARRSGQSKSGQKTLTSGKEARVEVVVPSVGRVTRRHSATPPKGSRKTPDQIVINGGRGSNHNAPKPKRAAAAAAAASVTKSLTTARRAPATKQSLSTPTSNRDYDRRELEFMKWCDRNHPRQAAVLRYLVSNDKLLAFMSEEVIGRRSKHNPSKNVGIKTCQGYLQVLLNLFLEQAGSGANKFQYPQAAIDQATKLAKISEKEQDNAIIRRSEERRENRQGPSVKN
ncbi:hypothetical protein BC940DRAFT_28776 [Gongronella butleri]|nr:hypothetical protein BC940DRAFT_28776 [Gongronella butleri]